MNFAQKKRARRELSQHWKELANRRTPEGWEKRCGVCGEWWPRDGLYFSWTLAAARFSHLCKPCDAEKMRRYRDRIKDGSHVVQPRRRVAQQEIAA